MNNSNSRGSDDNLGINQLLVKGRVLPLLIRGGHKGMSLILEPFANTELILGRPEELWDFSRVLLALLQRLSTNPSKRQGRINHSHHKVPAVLSTICALGVSKSKATARPIPSRVRKEGEPVNGRSRLAFEPHHARMPSQPMEEGPRQLSRKATRQLAVTGGRWNEQIPL